jgi:hypothetical protein
VTSELTSSSQPSVVTPLQSPHPAAHTYTHAPPVLQLTVACERAGQSASTQHPDDGTHRPAPALAPAQNFSPATGHVQRLAPHVAPPPQSAAPLQQSKLAPLDEYVHEPAVHEAACWHAFGAGQSVATVAGAQQPAGAVPPSAPGEPSGVLTQPETPHVSCVHGLPSSHAAADAHEVPHVSTTVQAWLAHVRILHAPRFRITGQSLTSLHEASAARLTPTSDGAGPASWHAATPRSVAKSASLLYEPKTARERLEMTGACHIRECVRQFITFLRDSLVSTLAGAR